MVKLFVFVVLLLSIIFPDYSQSASVGDYLPEIASPDQIGQELNLPPTKSLLADGYYDILNIEDWSKKNGLDITKLFQIVVLINKAKHGSRAQSAQIFLDGKLFKRILISTGREKREQAPSGKIYRSVTPTGWFHPIYFSPNHYSNTWETSMPWAIFFNGGIALHATSRNHYKELGTRASGGCVRFKHNDAKELYQLIRKAGKGMVPKFTQSGNISRDANGNPVLIKHFKTLIIVENDTKIDLWGDL